MKWKFEPVKVATYLYGICYAVLALVAYLTKMDETLRLLIDAIAVAVLIPGARLVRQETTTEANLRHAGFQKAANALWSNDA